MQRNGPADNPEAICPHLDRTGYRSHSGQNRCQQPQVIVSVLLILLLLLLMAGCGNREPAVQVQTGEAFTIGIGDSAEIVDQGLEITLSK